MSRTSQEEAIIGGITALQDQGASYFMKLSRTEQALQAAVDKENTRRLRLLAEKLQLANSLTAADTADCDQEAIDALLVEHLIGPLLRVERVGNVLVATENGKILKSRQDPRRT